MELLGNLACGYLVGLLANHTPQAVRWWVEQAEGDGIPINGDLLRAVQTAFFKAARGCIETFKGSDPPPGQHDLILANVALTVLTTHGTRAACLADTVVVDEAFLKEALYLYGLAPETAGAAQSRAEGGAQEDAQPEERPQAFLRWLWGHDTIRQHRPHAIPPALDAIFREQWHRGVEAWFYEVIKKDERARTALYLDCFATLVDGMRDSNEMLTQIEANLQGIESLAEQIRKELEGFRNDIRPALGQEAALVLWRPDPHREARYEFRAQRVPFFGRRRELEALTAFLTSSPDGNFSWWLMTGSGGTGKSRLALELCRRSRPLWHAGFLQDPQMIKAEALDPRQPTLIVIDYVAAKAAAVGDLLVGLVNRRNAGRPFREPLRVLLLERQVESRWWDEMLAARRNTLRGACHDNSDMQPLELARLPEEDNAAPAERDALAWYTITEIMRQNGKAPPDRDESLRALCAVDRQMRPLFAAFAADALVEGQDIRAWDRDRLFEDVIERERRKFWRPATGDDRDRLGRYENLVKLATLCGAIDSSILDEQIKNLPLPDPYDTGLKPTYEAMVGKPVEWDENKGAWDFPKLEPDILGAAFVLGSDKKWAQERHLLEPYAATLHATAWGMPDRRMGVGIFLNQAMDDFLGHPVLARLLEPPDGPRDVVHTWAMLAVNLIAAYGSERIGDAEKCLEDLRALSEARFPGDREIALPLAQGSYNLLNGYIGAERIGDAEKCLEDLRALSEVRFPGDREIALRLANGYVNLIAAYGSERIGDAEKCLEDLRALSEVRFPGDREIALELAKGYVNLIAAYGSERIGDAEKCLEDLRALSEARFPGDRDIALRLARGSFNLLTGYGSERIGDAEKCLEDLRALSEARFPGDREIALLLARGSFNLLTGYGSERMGAAEKCLEDLRALSEVRFPGDREIALELAKGSYNLLNGYGSERIGDAEKCLEDLRALSEVRFPGDREIALRLARGSFNLLNGYVGAERIGDAEKCLEDLRALSEVRFPGDREIALELAKGYVNLIAAYGSERIGDAEKCLEGLRALSEQRFPGDREIATQLGNSLFTLVSGHHEAGGEEEARRLTATITGPLALEQLRAFIDATFDGEMHAAMMGIYDTYIEPMRARLREWSSE